MLMSRLFGRSSVADLCLRMTGGHMAMTYPSTGPKQAGDTFSFLYKQTVQVNELPSSAGILAHGANSAGVAVPLALSASPAAAQSQAQAGAATTTAAAAATVAAVKSSTSSTSLNAVRCCTMLARAQLRSTVDVDVLAISSPLLPLCLWCQLCLMTMPRSRTTCQTSSSMCRR